MQKTIYTKIAADGSDLPADSTEKHLAVRVEHPMLKAPIVVAAYRAANDVKFADAKAAAEKHDAYGWAWRLPSVEEAFFIPDRTRTDERLDPNFFPDAEGWEYSWTGDVDASSPSDYAWVVYLGNGHCNRLYQSYRYHVRPVLAGQ